MLGDAVLELVDTVDALICVLPPRTSADSKARKGDIEECGRRGVAEEAEAEGGGTDMHCASTADTAFEGGGCVVWCE